MKIESYNPQPITLGALIEALESCPPDANVVCDWKWLVPGDFGSYRGFYDHLALGTHAWTGDGVTVQQLLVRCHAADCAVFEGYKGGEYRMTQGTPVWVSEYGESSSTALCAVAQESVNTIVLVTGRCTEWNGAVQRASDVLLRGLGWGNLHLPPR